MKESVRIEQNEQRGWSDMSQLRQICFDIDREEEASLVNLAYEEGVNVPQYLKMLLSEHIRSAVSTLDRYDAADKRDHPRKDVSILGVSCVRFSDNEMRSYPITIEDISKGGVRISFRTVDPDLADKLAFADYFEVVFTVPETTHTVSFYCKRMWASLQKNLNLAGAFEDANQMSIDLVSRKIIGAAH